MIEREKKSVGTWDWTGLDWTGLDWTTDTWISNFVSWGLLEGRKHLGKNREVGKFLYLAPSSLSVAGRGGMLAVSPARRLPGVLV